MDLTTESCDIHHIRIHASRDIQLRVVEWLKTITLTKIGQANWICVRHCAQAREHIHCLFYHHQSHKNLKDVVFRSKFSSAEIAGNSALMWKDPKGPKSSPRNFAHSVTYLFRHKNLPNGYEVLGFGGITQEYIDECIASAYTEPVLTYTQNDLDNNPIVREVTRNVSRSKKSKAFLEYCIEQWYDSTDWTLERQNEENPLVYRYYIYKHILKCLGEKRKVLDDFIIKRLINGFINIERPRVSHDTFITKVFDESEVNLLRQAGLIT